MYDCIRYYDPFFMLAIEGLSGDYEKDALFLGEMYERFKDKSWKEKYGIIAVFSCRPYILMKWGKNQSRTKL